jgi:hypothetical protein
MLGQLLPSSECANHFAMCVSPRSILPPFIREYYQDWGTHIGSGDKLNSHSMTNLQVWHFDWVLAVPEPFTQNLLKCIFLRRTKDVS